MNRSILLLILACLLFKSEVFAQGKFYTKTGKISFYSSTPAENIEAINKSSVAILDSKSGDLQFVVLMKGFEFRKALMQEHFNSKYVESDRYPKAEFKGTVVNNTDVLYTKDSSYTARVKGKLSMHGETKDMDVTGTITITGGRPVLHAVFNVLVSDFKISVPKVYRDNISNSIRVTVDCTLAAL